jgi:hypothetical protein
MASYFWDRRRLGADWQNSKENGFRALRLALQPLRINSPVARRRDRRGGKKNIAHEDTKMSRCAAGKWIIPIAAPYAS